MFHNFLDSPNLFRHLVEDLPAGIYIVDPERRIRFWNRSAERLTGHLSHEVVGHVLEQAVQICDRVGNPLAGDKCPISQTLTHRQPQQCQAFYLHKNGHRIAMSVRTRMILEYGDSLQGVTVLFEEAFVQREEASRPPLYGCLDATTGIPGRRLTQAILSECIAGMESSQAGFGLLRVRLLGLREFAATHGPQSVVPFLRTAAHTLRGAVDGENYLGCGEENEFVVILPNASPMMVPRTAEVLSNLLGHSEVLWWGDRFLVQAEVAYTTATPGTDLAALFRQLKPVPAGRAGKSPDLAAGAVSQG